MNIDIYRDYLLRSGDAHIDKIEPLVFLENDKGFCSFLIDGKILYVHQAYGDGRYWDNILTIIAKIQGCNVIRHNTQRMSEAWIRRYKRKVVGWILEKEVI